MEIKNVYKESIPDVKLIGRRLQTTTGMRPAPLRATGNRVSGRGGLIS